MAVSQFSNCRKYLKINGCRHCGRVAQLGEHLLCKQGVTGSIPVTSTNFSLIAKNLRISTSLETSIIRAHCARTVHECSHCTETVHIGAANKASVAADETSLARRLILSSASRFICNFICEYFLKTCASPWRSIWVTHSSATPPALKRVA